MDAVGFAEDLEAFVKPKNVAVSEKDGSVVVEAFGVGGEFVGVAALVELGVDGEEDAKEGESGEEAAEGAALGEAFGLVEEMEAVSGDVPAGVVRIV